MRRIIYGMVMGGAILWAMSAGAMTEAEECPGWKNQEACATYVQGVQTRERMRDQQRQQDWQAQQNQANRDAQLDAARQQALGMALFGSGNALINGMNQGFRPLPPYHQPGASR